MKSHQSGRDPTGSASLLKSSVQSPAKCVSHSSQDVHFFCLDCRDTPFCDVCCAENRHTGHHFKTLQDAWKYIKEVEMYDYCRNVEKFLNDTRKMETLIHQKQKETLDIPKLANVLLHKTLASCLHAVETAEKKNNSDLEHTMKLINESIKRYSAIMKQYMEELTVLDHNLRKFTTITDPRELCVQYRQSVETSRLFPDVFQHYPLDSLPPFQTGTDTYQNLVHSCIASFHKNLQTIQLLTQDFHQDSLSPSFSDEASEFLNIDYDQHWDSLLVSFQQLESDQFQSPESHWLDYVGQTTLLLQEEALNALDSLLRIQGLSRVYKMPPQYQG